MPLDGGVVRRVRPDTTTTVDVGPSSTEPSAATKMTSEAPTDSACRSAAMFTAYDSDFAPSSSHGARDTISGS